MASLVKRREQNAAAAARASAVVGSQLVLNKRGRPANPPKKKRKRHDAWHAYVNQNKPLVVRESIGAEIKKVDHLQELGRWRLEPAHIKERYQRIALMKSHRLRCDSIDAQVAVASSSDVDEQGKVPP